jgi:hypothetical protein
MRRCVERCAVGRTYRKRRLEEREKSLVIQSA